MWVRSVDARAAAAQTAVTGAIAGVAKDTSAPFFLASLWKRPAPCSLKRFERLLPIRRACFGIVDLRPGLYSVTFTLAGFRHVQA